MLSIANSKPVLLNWPNNLITPCFTFHTCIVGGGEEECCLRFSWIILFCWFFGGFASLFVTLLMLLRFSHGFIFPLGFYIFSCLSFLESLLLMLWIIKDPMSTFLVPVILFSCYLTSFLTVLFSAISGKTTHFCHNKHAPWLRCTKLAKCCGIRSL